MSNFITELADFSSTKAVKVTTKSATTTANPLTSRDFMTLFLTIPANDRVLLCGH